MISKDSPLRRLPAALDRKQALFIDGIRHAVDIVDLAYMRLCQTLTYIARKEPEPFELGALSAAAFADAWTIVDSIHRFDGMQKLMPGFEDLCGPRLQRDIELRKLLNTVKEVRDLGDHIASRVDQVLSKRVPILGALTWFTMDPDLEGGRSCLLAPGTLYGNMSLAAVNPGRPGILHYDTGLIHLATAVCRINLSDVHRAVAEYIERLESSVAAQFEGHDHAAADMLVMMKVKFATPTEQAGNVSSGAT